MDRSTNWLTAALFTGRINNFTHFDKAAHLKSSTVAVLWYLFDRVEKFSSCNGYL